jgi:hypothetical protein
MRSIRLVLSVAGLAVLLSTCGGLHGSPVPSEARAVTSASASPDPSSSPSSGSAVVRGRDLKAVDWQDITAPGAACFATKPIQLHNGYALLHHRTQRPALLRRPYSLDLETTRGLPEVTYGHLRRRGASDAAVSMFCSDESGVAEGILLYSLSVYSVANGHVHLLGLITPQVRPGKQEPATLIAHPRFEHREILVHEYFYGPRDHVCCSSGRATTVWVYRHGRLAPRTPTITREPR